MKNKYGIFIMINAYNIMKKALLLILFLLQVQLINLNIKLILLFAPKPTIFLENK